MYTFRVQIWSIKVFVKFATRNRLTIIKLLKLQLYVTTQRSSASVEKFTHSAVIQYVFFLFKHVKIPELPVFLFEGGPNVPGIMRLCTWVWLWIRASDADINSYRRCFLQYFHFACSCICWWKKYDDINIF